MTSITHRLGRRIRELRERTGWSQERLAEESGLHRTYVGSVERGERNISVVNIEQIARALGVRIATLFEDEPARRTRRPSR